MIVLEKYLPKDVVPSEELQDWKDRIRKVQPETECPDEVRSFIEAIARKLDDFGQIRKFRTHITGRELKLCNMHEFNGEKIIDGDVYPLNVPHMIAVDNYSSMMRTFRKKGKQGLIDFCKAKVKQTDLERILEILEVEVFHMHRPEFTHMLQQIEQSKKIDIQLEQ